MGKEEILNALIVFPHLAEDLELSALVVSETLEVLTREWQAAEE